MSTGSARSLGWSTPTRRGRRTEEIVRGAPSTTVECLGGEKPERPGMTLRWVLLHLIEETAHHAGHADSTREMVDGLSHD